MVMDVDSLHQIDRCFGSDAFGRHHAQFVWAQVRPAGALRPAGTLGEGPSADRQRPGANETGEEGTTSTGMAVAAHCARVIAA
jgi:hypothetical protein